MLPIFFLFLLERFDSYNDYKENIYVVRNISKNFELNTDKSKTFNESISKVKLLSFFFSLGFSFNFNFSFNINFLSISFIISFKPLYDSFSNFF
jgi:hypothetical protein